MNEWLNISHNLIISTLISGTQKHYNCNTRGSHLLLRFHLLNRRRRLLITDYVYSFVATVQNIHVAKEELTWHIPIFTYTSFYCYQLLVFDSKQRKEKEKEKQWRLLRCPTQFHLYPKTVNNWERLLEVSLLLLYIVSSVVVIVFLYWSNSVYSDLLNTLLIGIRSNFTLWSVIINLFLGRFESWKWLSS